MINLSTVAFQARNALRSSGINFSQTNALELVAALLGYGTYAALKLDPAVDTSEMFAEADHVVLQSPALSKRMRKLGLDQNHVLAVGKAVVDACRQAVEEDDNPCRFHASRHTFSHRSLISSQRHHRSRSD